MSTPTMEPTTGYELRITRTFDAPRELVWKAWTDPKMAKQWSGPRGFQAVEFEMPERAGERWHMKMVGNRPGTDEPVTLQQGGVVKEMRPPELLVYTFAWEARACVGLPESPFRENLVTIRLEEQGGKTVMHFTQGPFATESERDGHNGGWNSAFDRFAEFMLREQPERVADPNEVPTELHLKRFFAAPRQMVFDAWTRPEMVEQWWGPHGFTTTVEKLDARQGGTFQYRMLGPGHDRKVTGRFVEFYPPYRLHFAVKVLNTEGHAILEHSTTVFFEQAEGGTTVYLDIQIEKSAPEAANALKGMRRGWGETLDRLDSMLSSQAVGRA